ncbi:DNA damage-regulated autophagy modulator protein 1 [Myripristis murdjan]|uniref:DNA-damage regulated autophagy modulator 1 n=1 Tax=Myripristis murdjan TaxID=586833 RepID=A0A667YMA1_9TELE|nr:DNA damage-regulated autophagy modulator protein 1 [Myripristis murdjan]
MFWFMQGLCFLPAFLVIWSSSTFIVNYIIAIFRKDVDVIFPYISDTGALPPESCLFGLMTFISAFAGAATMYARYKYVEKLSEETSLVRPCLNKAALGLGMLACLGMCIVATFQETTVTRVHDAGAVLFFLTGVLYAIFQSVISHRIYPFGSSLTVCRIRTAIATLACLAFFPTLICVFFVKQTKLHRDTHDEDYTYHLASAVSEWIVAFSFVCFFLTYIDEFKHFTLQVRTEYVDDC